MSLLLSACGGTPEPAVPSSSAPAASTSASPSPTTSAPSTNPSDCFDGVCTIEVTKGTEFPLDAKAMGLTGLTVTKLEPGLVECELPAARGGAFTLKVTKPGESAAAGFEGGVSTWVTLVSITERSAVITLGHEDPP